MTLKIGTIRAAYEAIQELRRELDDKELDVVLFEAASVCDLLEDRVTEPTTSAAAQGGKGE